MESGKAATAASAADFPVVSGGLAEGPIDGMLVAMKPFHVAILAIVLAGCASAKQPETDCAKVNREIGSNANSISAVAASRGKVDRLSVPFWIPGGAKAVSLIKNRQTTKIEKLQAEQSALRADRKHSCP